MTTCSTLGVTRGFEVEPVVVDDVPRPPAGETVAIHHRVSEVEVRVAASLKLTLQLAARSACTKAPARSFICLYESPSKRETYHNRFR